MMCMRLQRVECKALNLQGFVGFLEVGVNGRKGKSKKN